MKTNYSKLMILILAALMCFAFTACAQNDANEESGGQAAKANGETLRIGLNNWAENIAVCNMWKLLLEEKGYKVKLVNGEKAVVWSGVAQGDLDIAPEVWLPYTDEPFWEEYKDELDKIGPWYEGTSLGLVVPSYVDINSIEELNDHKDKFDSKIVGIEEGASLTRMTEEAIEEYGLDYQLINSSEPAMMANLEREYKKENPILVTLWSPHWAFADYDLKYLEDPKKVFGEAEDIFVIANKDFKNNYPEVAKYLENWKMDDQSLGSLMAVINEVGDPAEGAKQWIEDNRDLVDEWLQ